MSTEAQVNAKLVETLESIATEMGFVSPTGNIKGYQPQFHDVEDFRSYFLTDIKTSEGIEKVEHRVWSVQVVGDDFWFTTRQDRRRREYTIDVVGFYDVGKGGSGLALMLDHHRLIRNAIFELSTNLGGVVDRVTQTIPVSPAIIQAPTSLTVSRLATVGTRMVAEKVGISE